MWLFYSFHGLLLAFSIAHTLFLFTHSATLQTINLFGPALMVVSAVSLLRFSLGRIAMRAMALLALLVFALAFYDGSMSRWVSLAGLGIGGLCYSLFGPASWWHGLYSPLGVFSPRALK
jgi:hypothetical protein